MLKLAKLRNLVGVFAGLTRAGASEATILKDGGAVLADLIAEDDWLPEEFATPDPARYRQYLLHCDSEEKFSVVSFVWGPGQATPVHDHTVWGLVGVLRGAERAQRFVHSPEAGLKRHGETELLERGTVDAVSPTVGDIHLVSNAFDDRTSISIHVYGANIGAVHRATYQPDGVKKHFISGYSNRRLPNLWDRSAEATK